MDKELLDGVRHNTPDINPRIANGLATEQLASVEQYVDQIFRGAAKVFPEGLVYKGYRRCSPNEEFQVATRPRDNKSMFELARSDFYMVAYYFEFEGVELYPRYMYLPYAQDGGIIHVLGNRFSIQPVLSDPSFSIGMNTMFIQLTKTKMTFERNVVHHFMANADRETTYVIWSWIHHGVNKKTKKSSKVVYSSLANYLFARFGVTGAFSHFAGADVVIGGEEINRSNYPADSWVICSSMGLPPRSWSGRQYIQPKVRVAVPKHQYTPLVKSLLGGFFYVADNFPDKIKPEHADDARAWKVVLGNIIFGSEMSVGLMLREIEEHLDVIDEYVDFLVKEDLHRSGIEIDDIYELFVYVIEVLSQKTVQSDVGISSIYGKRLVTLRYVVYDIVKSINWLTFKLASAMKNKGSLDDKTITNLMNKYLRVDRIASIRHKHGEITAASTSNDCMFFGITSAIVPQEDATSKGGGKSRINLRDPSKHVHVSVAEVASYNNLPKADPTGRRRVNPCLRLEQDGTVKRDPSKKALLDRTQQMLMR